MLPFVTRTDLTKAALKANISHEAGSRSLKMLLDEHSKDGARAQLKRLWTEWVKLHYSDVEQPCKTVYSVAVAAIPPGTPPNESAEAGAAAAP